MTKRDWKPGDRFRTNHNGPEANKWVFEVVGVDQDPVRIHAKSIEGGYQGYFHPRDIDPTDDPPTLPRFKRGQVVRVRATKEQFAGFEDAWELANGRSFVVKSIYCPPYNARESYGLKHVSRVVERDWLEPSDGPAWDPAIGDDPTGLKAAAREALSVVPSMKAERFAHVEALRRLTEEKNAARRAEHEANSERDQWMEESANLRKKVQALKKAAVSEPPTPSRIQLAHARVRKLALEGLALSRIPFWLACLAASVSFLVIFQFVGTALLGLFSVLARPARGASWLLRALRNSVDAERPVSLVSMALGAFLVFWFLHDAGLKKCYVYPGGPAVVAPVAPVTTTARRWM